MMHSPISLEIQCPVCLKDFSDPVVLPCEHSFCRNCITSYVNVHIGSVLCPECRQPFSSTDIRESRLLRNITEGVRKHLDTSKDQPNALQAPEPRGNLMCEEHDEKLKLFCVTDQRLACTICKEQAKHRGHTFQPVKEAAKKNKEALKEALGFLGKDNAKLHDLIRLQEAQINQCETQSESLSAEISAQFKTMHQFLRKREEDLQKELRDNTNNSLTPMWTNESDIWGKANDCQEKTVILTTALEIPRPDYFLQWWHDKGIAIIEGMKETEDGNKTFKSKVKNLVVIPDSLSMGPYESHLPFFVWKEMLQTIKPVPERLNLKDTGNSSLKVSSEGHSIRQADRKGIMFRMANYNPCASTVQTIKMGRHYCELEVGGKPNWSIGVKVEMAEDTKALQEQPGKEIQLHLKNGGYIFTYDGTEVPVLNNTKDLPRRIGLYLDCEKQQVSFYNADTMSLIHSSFCSFLQPYSITVCPGLYLDGKNSDPITFCWY